MAANNVTYNSGNAPASSPKNEGRCLPGIDPDQPCTYKTVFFGAPREYGPEEGWQTVRYSKKGRKARRYKEASD